MLRSIQAAIFLLVSCMWYNNGNAQLTVHNSPLYVPADGLVYVTGNVYYRDTAKILNNGSLELLGDWINESNTDKIAFVQDVNGMVIFSGARQSIGGASTRFPNLVLVGTGTKSLNTNTEIAVSLVLDGVELNVNGYSAKVLSADPSAVRSVNSGYVNSSTNANGWLVRNVIAGNQYAFPMGSLLSRRRYRPVNLTVAGNGMIGIQFQNYNPLWDGYDPLKFEADLSIVNNQFYHAIKTDSLQGSAAVSAQLVFDKFTDGNFETLALWGKKDGTGQWINLETSPPQPYTIPTADMSISSTGKFSLPPNTIMALALAGKKVSLLKIPNVITPNGDGKNDVFRIDRLNELYPDGAEISIYNRWGGEVYHAGRYANDWSGNGLSAGTYYYILKLRTAQKTIEVRKGWIEIIK